MKIAAASTVLAILTIGSAVFYFDFLGDGIIERFHATIDEIDGTPKVKQKRARVVNEGALFRGGAHAKESDATDTVVGQRTSNKAPRSNTNSAANKNNNNNHKSRRKTDVDANTTHKDQDNYHDYAVFITHYHKTGYVLSRELKNLVQEIEIQARRPDLKDQFKGHVKFEVSGIDEESRERFAFDQVGNWVRSAFPARQHDSTTQCPKNFQLKKGTIYAQESPDLFCSDEEIVSALGSSHKGGTKIVHFVRNPYDMVMSNYFYHSQDPTPEKWVHVDDPCEQFYDDGETLTSHVVNTLALELDEEVESMQHVMDGIVAMCRELYQSKEPLKEASFYEHLRELDQYDGLRLATAQMTVSSGLANRHLAGGDILRMANNLIKFKHLRDASTPNNRIELLTVSMDDFIKNTADNTHKFLNFVFGEDDSIIPNEVRRKAAQKQEYKYERKKGRAHVTQTNPEDKTKKEALREMMKGDLQLSSILNQTDILVNEALEMSGWDA